VQLEFEGRYAAMLSHEPKNYALLGYDGALVMRGVAFRSSRMERFGETFLREAVGHLLRGDVAGVRDAYVVSVEALQRRAVMTRDLTARVRLTKTPAEYHAGRSVRRELPYEALLSHGRSQWHVGERIRVYRAAQGRAGLWPDADDDTDAARDVRDYDVDFYLRVLRETFAARLAHALTPEDFAAVFADPRQLALFPPALSHAQPILTVLDDPL
jgi:hypothetical protein